MISLLRRDASDCKACQLGGLDLPRCVGYGPADAEVAVMGINPSIHARSGILGAFDIPHLELFQRNGWTPARLMGSERALWELVTLSGLNLSAVYSTNALKCATPENREPTCQEVSTCVTTHLKAELRSLRNPRTVLVLGRVAGLALGLSDFGERRRVEGTTAEAVLLRHPVATLRRWTARETEAARWREALLERAPPF